METQNFQFKRVGFENFFKIKEKLNFGAQIGIDLNASLLGAFHRDNRIHGKQYYIVCITQNVSNCWLSCLKFSVFKSCERLNWYKMTFRPKIFTRFGITAGLIYYRPFFEKFSGKNFSFCTCSHCVCTLSLITNLFFFFIDFAYTQREKSGQTITACRR